jgi:hypothetical protein
MRARHVVPVIAITVGVCMTLHAEEKKIARKDLPPAVEKTVAAQAKGATVRGFSREVEHGQTIYEAELTVNGHGRDISIDTKGNIIQVEEEVAFSSLPPAVQSGLKSAAGKGTITTVESVTRQDKLVEYEAHVRTGGKTREIIIGPDGKGAHPE